MTDKEIRGKLKVALDKLYQNDYSLIRRLCSERSIVFKLGIYLAQEFEGTRFDVDCEYNKNGVKPKALLGKRTNFPDIIVHKREQNENNLLIIEVKTPNDTNQKHFEADRGKISWFYW